MNFKPFVLDGRSGSDNRCAQRTNGPAQASTSVVHHGDTMDVLAGYDDHSVHLVIADPPYGLVPHSPAAGAHTLRRWLDREPIDGTARKGAFSQEWDSTIPGPGLWREINRVLKPGGYAFVFTANRTSHWTGMAMELAGFEPRDVISWINLQGFPKSLDEGVRIDEVLGIRSEPSSNHRQRTVPDISGSHYERIITHVVATIEFKRRSGLPHLPKGKPLPDTVQLKPSHEQILVHRKPLSEINVAANLLKHGTGALNIESARIFDSDADFPEVRPREVGASGNSDAPLGRFLPT